MAYRIRSTRKDELKNGRTMTYLVKVCDCSRSTLSYAFNGSKIRQMSKELALKILIGLSQESVAVKDKIDKLGIDGALDYYFEEI